MAVSAKRYNVKENEARAFAKMLRVSPQKLNLVASLIRGVKADKALEMLSFSKKRISGEVKKVVMSAMANAENNYGLDIDKLYVKEIYVGKAMTMKRWRPRSRGRAMKIFKPFSNLTVVVGEKAVEDKKVAKVKPVKENEKKEAK